MLDLLAAPPLQVFSILAAFVGLLVVLELGLMLAGASSDLGLSDAAPPDLDTGLVSPDAALAQVDPAVIDSLDPATLAEPPATAPAGGSLLAALGLGHVPVVLWLAILCGTIAAQGFFLQILLANLIGGMLPALPALLVTLPAAFWLTRRAARLIGAIIPQSETYATSARSFNRRRGTVTIGTARAGSPAEVRYSDGFGTLHYVLCEPLDRTDSIPAGTPVVILRTRDGQPRIVALQ